MISKVKTKECNVVASFRRGKFSRFRLCMIIYTPQLSAIFIVPNEFDKRAFTFFPGPIAFKKNSGKVNSEDNILNS